MPTEALRRLCQFDERRGASVAPKGEALELRVLRGEIEISVVVPESVLEWFVDASLRTAESRVSDWCDYQGYDATPVAELDRQMAGEVMTFVNNLVERDLRYVEDGKHPRLEWSVGGQWYQAIPLSPRSA